ncbi:MAG: hypothetical protein AVDCRST_MAG65-1051 [uncultured Solirubrobacteraceae bacterium]|uniref:Pycsar effector protein domain-containing protein n=1 Tax=uncultured Solirubrobacteraceae bacterium TaxID=1162706 RepID=A0A6J4RTL4_9ACTN|nr:MAG: hypothetical protein AVDCRST_MAG65-1051 [uncultured Solirubrobacteraceae bacterium]
MRFFKRSDDRGVPPPAPPSPATDRDHVQALYDRVIAWYEDAERKAQLILTLDGVFLSFLSTSAFNSPGELRTITGQFGWETWTCLGLMATALVLSIISAVVALRSRLMTPSALEHDFRSRGVNPSDEATYAPAVMWFFQHVADLEPDAFARAMLRPDRDLAVRSLAASAVPLARNVVRKHRWVNRGFFFAGAVLLFFLGAAVSYVLRTS